LLLRQAVRINKEAADPKAGGLSVASSDDVAACARFVDFGEEPGCSI
jgi:hypothetical protein